MTGLYHHRPPIAAAGNDNTATGKTCVSLDRNYLPGAWSQVISVGAHDRVGNRSTWSPDGSSASNYGPIAEVWTPGGGGSTRSYGRRDIPSAPRPNLGCYSANQCISTITNNSNLGFSFAGTSAATPIVAGTVALMKRVRPLLTLTQARSILKNTNRSSSDLLVNNVVNADAALNYLGAR